MLSSLLSILLERPIVFLMLMALPLALLAWLGRIYPQRRMLLLIALPAVVALAQIFWKGFGYLALILLILGIAVAIVDLFTIVLAKHFQVVRKCLKVASLGKPHRVELELVNTSTSDCSVDVRDDCPDDFKVSLASFETKLKPKSKTRFRYDFTSSSRGKFLLRKVYLAVSSRFGLWTGYFSLPCETTINVYPDMKQIAEYDLLARTNRLSQMGVRRVRRIGQDNEFERLRDYTKDDNYKHIDWRTTARRNKLTVKDFQSNQSQRIIFMVDCARMMTGTSGGLSMLDHAFNAMLMLSYIALKQGDSVGLLNFSNTIHSFTPPRGGIQHVNRLLHSCFDEDARYVEARYDKAFLYLKQKCPKRSLVVLITNVVDEVNANQILQYTTNLTGQHLPLCLLVKDHDMFDLVDQFDEDSPAQGGDEQLFNAAAAATIANWRHEVVADLKHRGVLAVETFPEQMTSLLINQYLEIKARHLL